MSPEPAATAPPGDYRDSEGRPREALEAERAPLSPEQEGEDDRLEPPGLATRAIAIGGAGVLVFLAAAMGLLVLFFRLEVGDPSQPPPKAFPAPSLEANIDPRVLRAVLPGAAQARPPVVPAAASEPLGQAMAAIAAKGAHAYDPLGAAAPPASGSIRRGSPQGSAAETAAPAST